MITLCAFLEPDNKVDLSLGRITCSNENEANLFVNKIIDYELCQKKVTGVI